jgi:hypothetical protein
VNRSKGTDVKLTVDSSESLEDAMRVLGALYGVQLVVASVGQDVPGNEPAASKPAEKPRTARKRKPATRKTRPAPASDTLEPKQRAVSASAGSPSNAEVRSWAHESGMTVSDRGRVPASVINAYRNAHDM